MYQRDNLGETERAVARKVFERRYGRRRAKWFASCRHERPFALPLMTEAAPAPQGNGVFAPSARRGLIVALPRRRGHAAVWRVVVGRLRTALLTLRERFVARAGATIRRRPLASRIASRLVSRGLPLTLKVR